MTLPTRPKQALWLAAQLEKGAEEEESLDRFALRIVDAFHDMLTADIKAGTPPLHVGAVFKSPFTTKVHLVAWMDSSHAWIVTADSRYGEFTPVDSPMWEYTEYTRSDATKLQQNPEWKVGDVVSRGQRSYHGKVIAVGNKCVLLECLNTGKLQADNNENMKQYYERES